MNRISKHHAEGPKTSTDPGTDVRSSATRFGATLSITLSLLLATVPFGLAETIRTTYDLPSGPSGNIPGGISWNPVRCSGSEPGAERTACSLIDPDNNGVVRVGVHSSDLVMGCGDCYSDFSVTVTDLLPAHTYFSFCVLTEHQDGRAGSDTACGGENDDIEDPRVQACGSASLTTHVVSGGETNELTLFVYASYVDETTGNICLGSTGTVTMQTS